MLVRHLRETKADAEDVVARGQCMVAAWMSVCGLANVTLGLSHGIGHQLGARCNVPHGETSAVMMPHVMTFNRRETMIRQAWTAATVAPAVATAARHAFAMRAPSSTTTALGQELCLVLVRSLSRRDRCAPSTLHPFGQCSGHAR